MFDLKEIAKQHLESAKQLLQERGQLMPVCLVVTPDGIIMVATPWRNEAEKRESYIAVSDIARASNALAVISINDTYMSTRAISADEVKTYRPGDLSKDPTAKEAITVGVKQADGEAWCLTCQYTRKDGKLIFAEPVETSHIAMNMIPKFGEAQKGAAAN
jgi:hypothetical protein